jgi:formylmethanofuran dehydrogenase subunit E
MNEVPEKLLKPRREIQDLLLRGETKTVLEMAGMLHGHYCPGLALGVKAVQAAFEKLGVEDNTGMEEVMAVVECNSCFVDGVQFASGCSLGNNALVYKDLGKTAATFYRRGASEAVRLCVKSFDTGAVPEKEKEEGDALFEKAVKRRERLTDEESRRMKELWVRRSFATAEMPAEELFAVSMTEAPRLAFAPIFDSQQCSLCGEKVMESRAGFRKGEPVCTSCAQGEYFMVTGAGIVTGNAARS